MAETRRLLLHFHNQQQACCPEVRECPAELPSLVLLELVQVREQECPAVLPSLVLLDLVQVQERECPAELPSLVLLELVQVQVQVRERPAKLPSPVFVSLHTVLQCWHPKRSNATDLRRRRWLTCQVPLG